MADPFVAEIRMFPWGWAPVGWAICAGQLLPISQNTALFSLLGTTYGGDGKSTFALPDLQGRAAMHPGQGPGLSLRDLGESGGTETVELAESQMPAHPHTLQASRVRASEPLPTGNLTGTTTADNLYGPPPGTVTMAPEALPVAGGGLPHNNLQPYLTVMFCIALQGVFPPRD